LDNREWVVQGLAADGSVESEVTLPDGEFEIGRQAEGLACPEDDQMADRHARLEHSETGVKLEDLEAGSGVWIRVRGTDGRPLEDGDQIWVGAQILVVRREAERWQVRHHGPGGRLRAKHDVPEEGFLIGRASDLVLDLMDGQLSRRHAQIAFVAGELRFFDRGAHNGSYLRLRAPEPVEDGSEFRIATHRFRLKGRVLQTDDPETAGSQGRGLENAASTSAGEPSQEPLNEGSDDPVEEATVLSLQTESSGTESELDPSSVAQSESPTSEQPRPEDPRRSHGLGARLRKLGRRISESGSERMPDNAADPISESRADGDAAERIESVAEAMADPVPVEEEPTILEASVRGDGRAEPEVGIVAPVAEIQSDAAAKDAAPDLVLLVIDSAAGSVSLEVEAGKTILEAVQEAGLQRGEPVDWECGDGGCGVCVVGVVEGADRIDPPDPATGEMKTIQITEQVAPDPRKYRLACLARVRGTVRLRKIT